MGRTWTDLPKPTNCFTARNTMMFDLNSLEVIRHYSANTKIVVVQKCVTEKGTFYRTESAKNRGLDWAFKASALGMPNEKAPSVPSFSPSNDSAPADSHTKAGVQKQTTEQEVALPKDGEVRQRKGWFDKLFRRIHV